MNLSEEAVRDCHGQPQSPGAGGWPTIRYFNKDTGYGGAAYAKKTDKAMCDELGDTTYMQEYIEEQAAVSLCDVSSYEKCNEKEAAFVKKWQEKAKDDLQKEVERISRTTGEGSSLTKTALAWAKKRMALIKKVQARSEDL